MNNIRKGIILAGGTGSRLFPATEAVSKQLLPVYDKPLIYYPISVLMLSQIREIAIITTPESSSAFKSLLGSGREWGVEFVYIEQPKPEGLAQAYLLAEAFLDGSPSSMILGDNIFYGAGFGQKLIKASSECNSCTVFGYHVNDPENFGVVEFDEHGKAQSIIEKPSMPASNYAVTGLYFLDGTASQRAAKVKPSRRGEMEITSLLQDYLDDGLLNVELLGRGYAWLDTGTHESLLEAGNFVRTMQKRQNLQVGCPEEIAFANGWIGRETLQYSASKYEKTDYGRSLSNLLKRDAQKGHS
jgi:glucose-1-phosphate thymidylyltransferase